MQIFDLQEHDVRFKQQNVAVGIHREIDATIIEVKGGVDPLERGHAARTDEPGHVIEESFIDAALTLKTRPHVSARLAGTEFPARMKSLLGWSPPVTADEADDSCRTLGVGGSSFFGSRCLQDAV
jgi:hypothetical protein